MASNRIPSRAGRETVSAAARIVADSDIVEHIWVLVDDGVEEANGSLAALQALLVEQIDNGSEDGGRGRGTADTVCLVIPDGSQLETESRDIGEGTARRVED